MGCSIFFRSDFSLTGCVGDIENEPADANLSNLRVNPGVLQPAFSGNIINYTVDVATSDSSVTVTAQPQDPQSTIKINNQTTKSLLVDLGIPGSSTPISIAVTSFNGNQKIYHVTVIRNVAPVANAGPDQGGKLPGAVINLDGSDSSDANGDPLTFSWSLIDKPAGSAAVLANPTSVMPTFTVDRDGDYIAQLIVNDGTVDSAPATVTITSNNVAPVANAGPDQGGKLPGAVINLDGSGSFDANGDSLTYAWTFVSKPAGSTATLTGSTTVSPSFTVDLVTGNYVVQLIVNDGTVNSPANSVIISTGNVAPVANAGPDQGGVVPLSLIFLDGSGSFDANGDPLTFSWSIITKPAGSAAVLENATTEAPTFTVDLIGTYVVQLIVNDGTADSPADDVTITSP